MEQDILLFFSWIFLSMFLKCQKNSEKVDNMKNESPEMLIGIWPDPM